MCGDRNRPARRRLAAAGLATNGSARASLGLALLLACAAATPAPSPAPSAAPAALSTQSYRVETDEIDYQGNGDYVMPHPVKLSRPGTDATAKSASGNTRAQTLELHGDVVVHDSGNAPEAASESDRYRGGGPSTLTSDELSVDGKALVYTATGHVHFTQGRRELTAERGTLDRGRHTLHVEGNVRGLEEDGTQLRARALDYDTASKEYTIVGQPLTIIRPVPSAAPGTPGPSPAPKKKR